MLKPIKQYCFLIFLLSTFVSFAQNDAIEIIVKEEVDNSKKNLSETLVQIINHTDSLFIGTLQIDIPEGIKSVSGTHIEVEVPSKSQLFVPIKLLIQASAKSGNKQINFRVFDNLENIIAQNKTHLAVQEVRSMYFSVEQKNIRIINVNDSVRVQSNVINRGNKTQEILLLYGIPDKTGSRYYVEKKYSIAPQQDTLVSFSFMPDTELINRGYFTLSASALYSDDRSLFGSTVIEVQNVSSVRKFVNTVDLHTSQNSYNNSFTTSFRQINENFNTVQFIGGGNINLPIGFLKAQGNLYKSNSIDDWIATNTFVSYQLEGSNIKFGSINENLNRTFFGRGASMKLKVEDQNTINVGFIDNQYNLLGKEPFLANGYAVYGIGEIGNSNAKRNFKSIYSFQDDRFERTNINVVGGEYQEYFSNKWSVRTRVLGALSDYHFIDKQEMSYSSELQYLGEWKDFYLSGSFFANSDYFPGDRRGIMQANQYIRKKLKANYTLHGRIIYTSISPKSHTNPINLNNQNLTTEVGVSLPNTEKFALSLSYQYHNENSNSYNSFITNDLHKQFTIESHRLSESINWISNNKKHSLFFVLDNGIVKYPLEDDIKLLFRSNITYSYNWLQLSGMYQYGGFYLPEYFQTVANQKDTYRRLNVNAGLNKNFLNNTMNVFTGVNYSKDYLWGETPSGFFRLTQNLSDKFSVYFNGMWFRYLTDYFPSTQTYNLEIGLTANLQGAQPSDKKKGKVNVFVYYDNNGNHVYDLGDIPAVGYYINLNNTSFITDLEGKFTYKRVPYGVYKIRSSSNKGWFNNNLDVEVSQLNTTIEVPLQQMGSISGKIQYLLNEKTPVDFLPKREGITLKISQGKNFVRRVTTNSEGDFSTFLPKGNYQIELEESSLQKDVSSTKTIQYFTVSSGTIYKIPTFELEVKQRRVNVKKFGQ
jgi:hypothetical protein